MKTRILTTTAAAAALTLGTAGVASASGQGSLEADPKPEGSDAEFLAGDAEGQLDPPVLEVNYLNELVITTWEPVEGAESYRWSLASDEETIDAGLTHPDHRAIAYDTTRLEPGFYTFSVVGFDENDVAGEVASVEVQVGATING